jgi:hypothetical protein
LFSNQSAAVVDDALNPNPKGIIMPYTSTTTIATIAAALLVAGAIAACGDDTPSAATTRPSASAGPAPTGTAPTSSGGSAAPLIDPGDGGDYQPQLDPAEFTATIDNPFLPMPVGASWRYEGRSDGEVETIEVTVTGDSKMVMGISAVVVRDTVTIGGELVEDTYDWYAQDSDGNVWYLGEDVKDYENGTVVSTAGSWEAGVNGALPGIVMPAAPAVGDAYRQEFLAGEAEDMMKIDKVGATLGVAAGSFDDVVITTDWTPLDPTVVEEKAYARGIGKIREDKVAGADGFAELVEFSLG